MALALLFACDKTSSTTTVDALMDVAPAATLPLGSATATDTSCTQGAQPGATCKDLEVTCGATSLGAELAISLPSGPPAGTITLHAGGAGTGYWGTGQADLVASFVAAGFRVVQIKWKASWQVMGVGARHSACLPATAYRWIYDQLHGADPTKGFCGGGTSGGGATLAYSLSAYGLGEIFDYTMIVSGPAVSKMDVGCDLADYSGPAPTLCPEISNVLDPLPASAINGIETTSTCSCTSPGCATVSDIATWHADSVVTDGAEYAYPKTQMSFWFCGNQNTNGSTGGGAFYYDAVSAVAGNDVSLHCYAAGSTCTGEQVFQDPNALHAAVAAMTAGCVARP